jgi:hypothetical protein
MEPSMRPSMTRSVKYLLCWLKIKFGIALSVPGPDDFVGSYNPRASDAQEGGQATYDGSINVTMLDRNLVEKVLPVDFRLAQRKDGGLMHPVIHLVGHQRNLMLLVSGTPLPAFKPDYDEFILLIPFVIRGSGTKKHSFVVRMYLSDPVAVALGTIYEYAKELALLTETGTTGLKTSIRTTVLFELLFEGAVKLTGAWRTAENASLSLPGWTNLQEIFKMPLVGATVLGGFVRTACSYWEWDFTSVEVAPATSRHRFLRPLREGMDDWVRLGPLWSASTYAIRGLRWRLATQPPPCQF